MAEHVIRNVLRTKVLHYGMQMVVLNKGRPGRVPLAFVDKLEKSGHIDTVDLDPMDLDGKGGRGGSLKRARRGPRAGAGRQTRADRKAARATGADESGGKADEVPAEESDGLDSLTKAELRAKAKKRDITVESDANKAVLLAAIRAGSAEAPPAD